MTVSFGCDNIIKSKYWISNTTFDGFSSNSQYLISGFRLKLSLTYRINDYKPRKDNNDQNEQGGGMQMM